MTLLCLTLLPKEAVINYADVYNHLEFWVLTQQTQHYTLYYSPLCFTVFVLLLTIPLTPSAYTDAIYERSPQIGKTCQRCTDSHAY
jgi:hypothetical protein